MLKKILIAILLIVVFAGSGLLTFYGLRYGLSHTSTTLVTPAQNQFDGHAYFVSGGQLNETNVQGNNDELQLELHHVPAPAPGKSYYAWLLSGSQQNPSTIIRLGGALSVDHGNVHFLYAGTPDHKNLLGIASSLLITEEPSNTTPVSPTTDKHMWSYYGALPQQAAGQGKQKPTALDSLRALLYEEPNIGKLGIHGGLNIQLLKNTGKILEWIYSARGSTNTDFMHRELVRTLDYLDGQANVQLDTPANTAVLVDPVAAQVPMLDRLPNQAQASYLDIMTAQLSDLLAAPDITPATRRLGLQIKEALSGNIQTLFTQVRLLATKLVALPPALLLLPASLAALDNMVALSNVAFVGRLDPATNELQPGVVQLFYDIQHLASYDITPFTAGS